MAKKIVNLRLSEEMIDLINQQIGDTFTQKFENMVTRCMWELPTKEQELEEIKKRINIQRKLLYGLIEEYRKQKIALEKIISALEKL